MPKILYIGTPHSNLRNIGDQAQAVAIRRWLAKHWPGVDVLEFHKKQFIQRERFAEGDLIFLHSGGNMANRARMSEKQRLHTLLEFADCPTISLPQTISFTDEVLDTAREVYNAHSDLTIYARDPMSYSHALENFPECKIGLCPDFVLGYPYEPPKCKKEGVLLCLRPRNDGESAMSAELWGHTVKICEPVGKPFKLDTGVSQKIGVGSREAEFLKMLDKFAHAKLVVTDRLHGVIFSILAQTPCIVVPTVDHKLTGSWWFFKDMPQVVFSHLKLDKETVDKALSVREFVMPDWHAEWFDPVADDIKHGNNSRYFDFSAFVEGRRTRRRWLDMPIAGRILKELVQVGVHAPSGSNAQCVRFKIETDPAVVAAICKAKGTHGLNKNHPAAIILVGYDYNVPGTILHKKKTKRWLPLAYQDVAAAMYGMSLAAEARALAVCWISLFDGGCQPVLPECGVEWISALLVGWGDEPWRTDEKHGGLPVVRAPLSEYLIE